MASKNLSFLYFFIIFLQLSTLSSQLRHRQKLFLKQSIVDSHAIPSRYGQLSLLTTSTSLYSATNPGGGEWTLLHKSVGVSAMHMQLLYNNKVVIFDRTDFGLSNLTLPAGKCRYNDEVISKDCTAHSLVYDIASNTYRPLTVKTDVWCSSGAVSTGGTLIQTGGYHAGDDKIRIFSPCNDDKCDWIELPQNLTVQRWYSSDQILPDGRVIIVGGRRAFSYEFFPNNSGENRAFYFPFLRETTDPEEENNLYPFLHLLPDGNLFVFANQQSVVLDYVNNKIVKKFPSIPGEKRTYRSTGSSVMLPLKLRAGGEDGSPPPLPLVEVMVCGGNRGGSFVKARKGTFIEASKSCGRLRVTDPGPSWVMENMPLPRIMPDMLLLPTGDVIILNGAAKGTAGWECATDPVLNPVLYTPTEPDPEKRFNTLNPTTIARMYHSAATLLPDCRILVGGSNPHIRYNFTKVRYPTELSLEAYSPPYLDSQYGHLRPSILSLETPTGNILSYGQQFSLTFRLELNHPGDRYTVTMIAPSFTTHSFAMNQRLLELYVVNAEKTSVFTNKITVCTPPTRNIAPPGYYMLFVVYQGVPSQSVWIRMK